MTDSGLREHFEAPPAVIISTGALATIAKVATSCPVETGGLFIGGKTDGGTYVIVAASGPGDDATHQALQFSPDVNHYQRILNRFFSTTKCDYIGEFHKHPGENARLSQQDRVQARKIIEDPGYNPDSLLVGIVNVVEGQTILYLYGCSLRCDDLRVRRLDFEVITMEVSPGEVSSTGELPSSVDPPQPRHPEGSEPIRMPPAVGHGGRDAPPRARCPILGAEPQPSIPDPPQKPRGWRRLG